uniref:Uncharacterized protein n=1 Tax=Anguilla anguilla TaxID=7936 RepID=A0A0E9T9J8_ANGAN
MKLILSLSPRLTIKLYHKSVCQCRPVCTQSRLCTKEFKLSGSRRD